MTENDLRELMPQLEISVVRFCGCAGEFGAAGQ